MIANTPLYLFELNYSTRGTILRLGQGKIVTVDVTSDCPKATISFYDGERKIVSIAADKRQSHNPGAHFFHSLSAVVTGAPRISVLVK